MNRSDTNGHVSPVAVAALVGRRRELRLVKSFLGAAAAHGGALLLLGEPGVGKTVLLDVAVLAATARDARVLRATGVEFESDIGYAGLHQLLAPLMGEVERLDPVHRAALVAALGHGEGPVPGWIVVSTAVLELLRLVAAARPVLVVVDDFPWLDRASVGVLAFVARRIAGTRIGIIAAARCGDEAGCVDVGLPVHEVQPLDEEAAEGLLDSTFPDLAPAVRRRVLDEAAGNPLALLELPAALSGRQRLAVDPLPSVLPLGRRLQTLFTTLLRGLPAATRELLLLAALDGSGDLRRLSAVAGPGGIDDLAPAERARVVRVDESCGVVVFRHPLVRAAVVEQATSADRRRAHRKLAAAMLDHPERRAWHLAHATVGFDEEVATLLERAARTALRRGDTTGAVSGLLRAAELSSRGSDRGRRLAEAAQVGVVVSGGLRHVPQLLVDARLADPDGNRTLPAATAGASLLFNGEGDVDTAHRLLVGAIEEHPRRDDPDDEPLAEALQALFTMCVVGGGRTELWEPFERAVARLEPHVPDVLALGWRVSADPARTTDAALGDLEAAIRGLHDETDPARIVRIGRAANVVDRVGGCREALWRVVRDGRSGGAVTAAINALALLSLDLVQQGRWAAADGLSEEGLSLCAKYGYRTLAWPFWLATGLVAAGRGNLDATTALAGRMVRWALPRDARSVVWHACHVTSLAALGHADFEKAFRQVQAISPPGVLPRYVPLALWSAMDLVEAAVHTGRQSDAERHVAVLHESGVARISSRLALLVGGATAIAAPADEAPPLFEKALDLSDGRLWPFERARIQLAYGEHLRRTRAITAARTQLTEAMECFSRLGAASWVERTGKELRAAGRRRRRADAAELLTPQEREIALLAAKGMTNKQIGQQLSLSHRTVGAHLYRIFPKLGIASRAALRDALEAQPHL